MCSKITYRVGSLSDWLNHFNAADMSDTLHDGVTREEIDQALSTARTKRIAQFQLLLTELHERPVELSPNVLQHVLACETEYVLCVWTESTLVATAQGSLLFASMRPTVHISNVVVTAAYRSKGLGEFLMVHLRKKARSKWGTSHDTLRFVLTSQEKRHTRVFYEKLGYVGTPTIRYER